uniref:SAP domain-containing protein n=1 Tax=Esox lucius TaxID=8010 RepID=A0AAY5KSS4_ESOLU
MNLKVDAVRNLCKECKLDTKGSKMDLIMRLRGEMQTRSTYDMVFEKVWGASATHVFLMRCIIHHHNQRENQKALVDLKNISGRKNVTINSSGQAVLAVLSVFSPSVQQTVPPPARSAFRPVVSPALKLTVPPVAPPADKPADSLSDQLVLQQLIHDHDYWSVAVYSQEMHPVQDMLLNYVLDTHRPAAEILAKDGNVCLTREDFWTLGLPHCMESNGKDVHIVDMYVVPTWKLKMKNPMADFPHDLLSKDSIIIPAWSRQPGKADHYFLC